MTKTQFRADIFGVSVIFCLLASAAAADDWSDCFSEDLKLHIRGCTQIIQQGEARRTREQLALAYDSRGLSYHYQRQFDRAIADYSQAIGLHPNDQLLAWVYNNRGLCWRDKGDLDRALADGTQAIQLDPKRAEFYSGRGGTLREMGELDRALVDFEKSISLAPKAPLAYIGRGLTWRAKGNLDKAVVDYQRAIGLNPKLGPAYVGRGFAYEAKGEIERARADYKTAISLPRTSVVSRNGAIVYSYADDRLTNAARARLAVLTQQRDTQLPAAARATKDPISNPSPPDDANQRIALVIGNGAYPTMGALPNPPNDARAMAKVLRAMGVEVIEGIDLNREGFERTVGEFLSKAAKARTALVFYAGHGVQIDGRNYLVPIDAKIFDGGDFTTQMTSLDTILAGLDDQIRTNIIILDACRNNPLAPQEVAQAGPSRSLAVRSGLAAPSDLGKGATLGAGTLLAFATGPGQVALDGEGDNSPFSTALLRHLPTPGLEVQTMLTRVRAEVVASTRSKQVPWSTTSLLGEVYLAGKP